MKGGNHNDGPLGFEQLKKLREHKYSATGKSLIEPYFQLFWNWLIEKVPLWLAPNTMTLFGLVLNVASIVIMTFYSPDGKSEIPAFVLVFSAVTLFIYQTLDALDGKQARRTNTSSPLGELFDHGCDSISTVFVTLGVSLAVGLGSNPWFLLFEVMLAVCCFYMAHWQCYVTGTIQFGSLDVTEAQAATMAIYLVSAAFGVDFWSYKLPIIGIELKMIQFLGFSLSAVAMVCRFALIIQKGGQGRHGTTVANTSVLFPFFPIFLAIGLSVVIAVRSTTDIYLDNPCLYLIALGLVSSKIINKLVVAHMTKSEIELLDWVLLGPALLLINQMLNYPVSEYILLWACLFHALFNSMKYCKLVCVQIADFLNIYIFRTDKLT